MNKSVATINSPEFINLKPLDINPLMSACEIKVLYVGENRNRSYITKDVATEMAKTLRGAPIVGYYKDEKQDFRDHGKEVIIDDEGIKFNIKTVPYGFVAPDAKVWFKEFEDTNDFGETILREYLMTTGYLWTGQFEECKIAVESDGKPQSMELDEDTVRGHWETNTRGMDFFIINDAIFSKLCILGDDIEPCFEGASVTTPNVSASFTKVDDTFRQTLFTMMQELKTALGGGQQMIDAIVENTVIEEPVAEPVIEEPVAEPVDNTDPSFAASQEPVVEDAPVVEGEPAAEPVEPEPEVEPITDPEPVVDPDPTEPEAEPAPSIEEQYTALQETLETVRAEYSALEIQYNDLQTRFSALETAHADLVEFKRQSDDAKKDEMIGRFYMLSDEDKAEVISNKANYTVEDIEEKLSVICFRKKVNFELEDNSKNNNKIEQPAVTFNVSNLGTASKPDWLKAVDNAKNQ
jgi:hypothetical protein